MNLDRFSRENDREGGFTLIELMVVVIIIAILLAIAVPTFLGARNRARDSVAKSSLRTALSAANVLYQDNQNYTGATSTAMATAEGSLSFLDGNTATNDSTGPKVVSNYYASGSWAGATLSDSGTCFLIKVTSAGAVTYGTTSTTTNCDGTYANTNASATSPSTGGW